jgi:hypothetical protein
MMIVDSTTIFSFFKRQNLFKFDQQDIFENNLFQTKMLYIVS